MPLAPELSLLRSRLGDAALDETPAGEIAAAVMVGFVQAGDGVEVLLTKRTESLSSHAGEICFPGGRVEPGETPLQAAVREAGEELGIAESDVEVLGPLPWRSTRVSGYAISPWGALVRPPFNPNESEIAEVILLPTGALRAPGARRDQWFIRGSRAVPSPAFDVDEMTIWGATAQILAQALDLMEPDGGR